MGVDRRSEEPCYKPECIVFLVAAQDVPCIIDRVFDGFFLGLYDSELCDCIHLHLSLFGFQLLLLMFEDEEWSG
jgi:hypothetical protein